MSKALVVKDADFSTNKVTRLNFGGIPCTGIELDESSISIDDYDTIAIGYTVTPANTTDNIVWTSSDEDVVSVASGVITPVGLGSATVTATCGNFTDSVTINVNIKYIPMYSFDSASASGSDPKQFPSNTESYNRILVSGYGLQSGIYKCYGRNGATDKNIIKLPKNTDSVTVKNTNKSLVNNGNYAKVFWLKDVSCDATGFEDYALYVSDETFNFNTTQEKTFTVPEGADSMLFVMRTQSTYTSEDDPANIASSIGFSLTFNVATE